MFPSLPAPTDDGTLTKTAFAAELGVSKGRVSQLLAQGMPVLANGRIDRAAALGWYESNIDPSRRKSELKGNARRNSKFADLKGQKEAEQVRLLRLEYEKRTGQLVDRDQAEKAIVARAKLERDAHLAWVMRTAPVLAAKLGIDGARLFAELDRMMREHLAELTETPLFELENAPRRAVG